MTDERHVEHINIRFSDGANIYIGMDDLIRMKAAAEMAAELEGIKIFIRQNKWLVDD